MWRSGWIRYPNHSAITVCGQGALGQFGRELNKYKCKECCGGLYLPTKEEEKEQQEEDQRAKPQRAKPQSPPNPPIRIHCTNGNYAYLTEAVLWGQSQLKTLFHRYGDQADARARREDVTISGSDAECEGPWRSCMYFLILDDVLEIKGS